MMIVTTIIYSGSVELLVVTLKDDLRIYEISFTIDRDYKRMGNVYKRHGQRHENFSSQCIESLVEL